MSGEDRFHGAPRSLEVGEELEQAGVGVLGRLGDGRDISGVSVARAAMAAARAVRRLMVGCNAVQRLVSHSRRSFRFDSARNCL